MGKKNIFTELEDVLLNQIETLADDSLFEAKLAIAKEGSRCGLYDKFLGIESNG